MTEEVPFFTNSHVLFEICGDDFLVTEKAAENSCAFFLWTAFWSPQRADSHSSPIALSTSRRSPVARESRTTVLGKRKRSTLPENLYFTQDRTIVWRERAGYVISWQSLTTVSRSRYTSNTSLLSTGKCHENELSR